MILSLNPKRRFNDIFVVKTGDERGSPFRVLVQNNYTITTKISKKRKYVLPSNHFLQLWAELCTVYMITQKSRFELKKPFFCDRPICFIPVKTIYIKSFKWLKCVAEANWYFWFSSFLSFVLFLMSFLPEFIHFWLLASYTLLDKWFRVQCMSNA